MHFCIVLFTLSRNKFFATLSTTFATDFYDFPYFFLPPLAGIKQIKFNKQKQVAS